VLLAIVNAQALATISINDRIPSIAEQFPVDERDVNIRSQRGCRYRCSKRATRFKGTQTKAERSTTNNSDAIARQIDRACYCHAPSVIRLIRWEYPRALFQQLSVNKLAIWLLREKSFEIVLCHPD